MSNLSVAWFAKFLIYCNWKKLIRSVIWKAVSPYKSRTALFISVWRVTHCEYFQMKSTQLSSLQMLYWPFNRMQFHFANKKISDFLRLSFPLPMPRKVYWLFQSSRSAWHDCEFKTVCLLKHSFSVIPLDSIYQEYPLVRIPSKRICTLTMTTKRW